MRCEMWMVYGEGPVTSTSAIVCSFMDGCQCGPILPQNALVRMLRRAEALADAYSSDDSMIPKISATTRCGGRWSVRTR